MISIAGLHEGKFARSFATFGVERRGAPVAAFVMIGKKEEMTRSQIYTPDHVVVLDSHVTRSVKVADGLKENGTLTINTARSQREILKEIKPNVERLEIGVLDATSIAQKTLGKPITNTVMLGAFARITKIVSIESILIAIDSQFKGELADKNRKAAKLGFEKIMTEKFP
jgi:pyruvate ferredoxin oxidoreductase gamma subunit